MTRPRVLILGGTSEARDLATDLRDSGTSFVSSLAGAVRRPRLPVGEVRIGGFGGVAGLFDYLRSHQIGAVIDATHPFAEQISSNAAKACVQSGTPLLRLERPGWEAHPHAATWTWVADHLAAADAAAANDGPVLLTTGRRHLDTFLDPLAEHQVIARVVDSLPLTLPSRWSVIEARGPYDLDSERDLLLRNGIRTLVTKDSGGSLTAAKLDAAAELGIHVVIVRRTPTALGIPTVRSVAEAVHWLDGLD